MTCSKTAGADAGLTASLRAHPMRSPSDGRFGLPARRYGVVQGCHSTDMGPRSPLTRALTLTLLHDPTHRTGQKDAETVVELVPHDALPPDVVLLHVHRLPDLRRCQSTRAVEVWPGLLSGSGNDRVRAGSQAQFWILKVRSGERQGSGNGPRARSECGQCRVAPR